MIRGLLNGWGKARSPKSQYFLSFSLVILITATTLGALFSMTSARMMVDTFTENHLIGLNHLVSTMDLILEQADRVLLSVGLNSSLEDYEKNRTTDVVAARRIQESLDNSAGLDSSISSICVVFPDSRKVVSSTLGYLDVQAHYDHEFLTKLLESPTRPPLWHFRQGPTEARSLQPLITIVRPLPIGRYVHPNAFIVLNIHSSVLDKAIRSVTMYDQSILQILNRDNHVVFESRDEGAPDDFQPNRTKTLVLHVESERHPFRLIYSLPSRVVTRSADELGLYILAFCVGIGLLSLLMSSALAEALQYPIRRLQRLLFPNPSLPLSFSQLETGVSHLVEENVHLRDALQGFLDQRRNRLVLDLLEGRRILDRSSLGELGELGLAEMEHQPLLVACFRMDLSALTVEKEVFLAIQRHLEEQKERFSGVVVRQGGDQLLMILGRKGPTTRREEEELWELQERVFSELSQRFPSEVRCGVSAVNHGLGKVNMAYRQSMAALSKGFFDGESRQVFIEDHDVLPAAWVYPYPVERRLVQTLFDRQEECEVMRVFEEFVETVGLADSGPTAQYYCYNQLMHTVMGSLFSRDQTVFSQIDKDNQFQVFFSALDVPSQVEAFRTILSKVIWLQKSRIRLRNTQLIDDVKRHIENNLDRDLSFKILADHFRISSSYLRKLFKENVGKTLKEFSLDRKMARAKQLLEMNRVTVQEIARSLGFQTTQSFIRCFKHREGLPPGQFRSHEAHRTGVSRDLGAAPRDSQLVP